MSDMALLRIGILIAGVLLIAAIVFWVVATQVFLSIPGFAG